VVADDLKAIASVEAFAAWKNKAEVLFKPYLKTAIAAAKCKADEEAAEAKTKADEEAKSKFVPFESKVKEESKASEEVSLAVEKAIENANVTKDGIPNSSSVVVPGMKEKFAVAFAEENFIISK
jgi:hypothetical protein